MKAAKTFLAFFMPFALLSCAARQKAKMTVDFLSARKNYSVPASVFPMDDGVTIYKDSIVIAPADEKQTYTISGYFNGQVVVSTKNTVIKLKDAYLENTDGKGTVKCLAKAEISAAGASENYIVSRGRGYSTNAALQGRAGLVIGGSGALFVCGNMRHAVEAKDVKIKGSGSLCFQGTAKGSAIKCASFATEPEKTFSARFINSKNGIKADSSIAINSGAFYFYNNDTALKTDVSAAPGKKEFISLNGGTFYLYGNRRLFVTQKNSYSDSGAAFIQEE